MDCNLLDPQEETPSDKSFQGLVQNHELQLLNQVKTNDIENALKLNNSGQNLHNSLNPMSTNSVIQLTKRNILRDEINVQQFSYGNDLNDEEKENRYTEVIYFYINKCYFRC